MTRPATCHPDRAHYARGLCEPCWRRDRARLHRLERLGGERPCTVCGDPLEPFRANSAYCSAECREVASSHRQSLRRGMIEDGEEFHATRSRRLAAELASAYVARGCRRVGHRAGSRHMAGAWVAAWHRGGGLYLIRARLPVEYQEVA